MKNPFDLVAGWQLKAVLAAVLIGILFAIGSCGHRDGVAAERKRMAPVIAGYQVRIDRLLAQITDLEGKLTASNAAVDQLKADADERERSAAAQIRAARTEADRYRLRAAEIAAARPTGDQCEAAADLIRVTLSEERK
jgi:hypothetical protein